MADRFSEGIPASVVNLRPNHSHNVPVMERNGNRHLVDHRPVSAVELTSANRHKDTTGKNGWYSKDHSRSKSMNLELDNKKYSKLSENGGYHPQNGDLAEIIGPNSLNISFDNFHIREFENASNVLNESDDYFAGRRDVLNPDSLVESKIISKKGTCRGFKNRVRAGINTFIATEREDRTTHSNKNYRISEKGKIVVYTTSVAVVRETYDRCKVVKNILQNHMVRFEERDLCMSRDNQKELMQRLKTTNIVVPQVFVDGRWLGGLEDVVSLNECGELRTIFRNFQKVKVTSLCEVCGGYRFIPCTVCHGSKKSIHRNNFTAEFCALRCMHCDEHGLVRCPDCVDQQE